MANNKLSIYEQPLVDAVVLDLQNAIAALVVVLKKRKR